MEFNCNYKQGVRGSAVIFLIMISNSVFFMRYPALVAYLNQSFLTEFYIGIPIPVYFFCFFFYVAYVHDFATSGNGGV